MLRFIFVCSLVLASSACVTASPVEPIYTDGSDRDLYRSLADLGAMTRVEEGCNGRSTSYVTNRWIERDYPRERAIRAMLEQSETPAKLEAADEISVHGSCGKDDANRYWRRRYETVLAALEKRLGLPSSK